MAGVLPAIGPVIAGGTLAALLASAATGAAAAGLVGALIGMGIPKDEAEYYEEEFKSGRILVTVKADGRYDEARDILRRNGARDYDATGATSTSRSAGATGEHVQTMHARQEELRVNKQPVETGEVRVHKEVHTEHRTVEVPVSKEEVVVERQRPSGHEVSGSDIGEEGEIRIPVSEEQVHVEKQPVVTEEVRVSKHPTQQTQSVAGTVRKEEVKIEKKGDVDVREKR